MEDEGISTLSLVDYVVFSLLLVVSFGIGIYSYYKNRANVSTQQYTLGGQAMSPVPVAMSLIGGVFSAISILGECYPVISSVYLYLIPV